MSKPAGIGGFPALFAHKGSDLDAWEKIVGTATHELAVDSNYSSMSFDYNTDNTVNYIDINKSIDGATVTVRLSFTYNAAGLVSGITKAVV